MSPDRRHPTEPGLAYSLTRAVEHVLRQAGGDVDLGTVHTALGLGLLLCAAPDDPDVRRWPAHARDAFLVEGGRPLGLTIRPMHPPEAARGLGDATEFRQHFDASYRPLVMRALEHDQPVLAWRAFGGDRSRAWGIITGAREGGLGLSGLIVTDRGLESGVTVETPPAQLYVVERFKPRPVDGGELIHAIVRHARTALDGSLDETFGVVTGAAALGEWAGLISEVPADVTAFGREHAGLAQGVVAGLHALAATIDRAGTGASADEARHVERIHSTTSQLIDQLNPLTEAETVSSAVMAPQDLLEMRQRVIAAKKALEGLAAAL